MVNKKLFKLLSTLIVTFSVLLTSCSSNSSQGTNSGNSSNNGGGGSSNTSHEHTFDDKWEYNDTYHWHSSTCGHDVKANEERHNFTSTVTDPTYEEGGYTTYTCSTCGYSYVDNETDKLEHNYSSSRSYDENSHWHACTDEGYEDLKKDESSHNFTSIVTDPTYEEGGYTTYTCSECGYSYVDNETDKLEHNYSSSWSYDENSHWHACTDEGYEDLKKDESSHNFTSLVTDPTYEEGGYTTYTCSTCGYSYVDNETDKLEHNYSSSWSYDENSHWHACTDEGYEDLKKDESSHNFTSIETDPTYEEGGYTTYTCSTCGYSYVDNETDKLEHNYSSSWSYDENSHWHACTDEGYEDLKKDESSHNFTSIVTDPIYEEGGYTTYTCSTCGYSYVDNKTDPLFITITWKNYDGTILEVDNNVSYGTTPTYEGATPIKESDGRYKYTFAGWTPEVVKATKDATYTAVFSEEKITYTIDFDLNGGASSSYKGLIEVTTFSKDIFFFDCVKEDWQFRGWEYNGEKIFDEKGNQLKNVTLVDNMIFKAIYSQTVKLNITTNMPEAGTITGEGEYPYNTYVDVTVTPNQGYKFVGWYYQNTLLSNVENYKYMMWDIDITLEARFEKDDFNLKIYSNNEDYGLVLLKSNSFIDDYKPKYTSLKEYGSEVTIAAYSKSDVRFLGWYDENNVLVTTNAVYTFLMPNHDYTLEAKWNYFTINYNLNGGVNNPNNPNYYTTDDGNIHLQDPTKKGYEFVAWKYNDEIIDVIDVNLVQDITLEAIWSDYKYEIREDNNGKYAVIIGYDDSITNVIIPESVILNEEVIRVKELNDNIFKNNEIIESIIIPNNIITIGDSAFYNCSNLKTVTISENSQLTTIENNAFYNCSLLSSIYIPVSVTSIGNSAFYGCSNLATVTISENSQLTTIGVSAFEECSSLTSIYIPSSVTTIGTSAFSNCSKLTTVTIGENSQLTSIGYYAFIECSSLTSIYIPDSVTTIGDSAFYNCNSVTSIYIPSSVTTLGDSAFYGCSNLTIYCEASSLPSGWDSSWNPSNRPVIWNSYGGIHGNLNGLDYIAYQDKEENSYIAITGYNGSNSDVVIPKYIEMNGENIPVKEIANDTFKDYTEITSVTIPDSVTTIGDSAFYNCNSVTSIYIPSSVTTLGDSAFYGCSNLTIYCEASSLPSGWDSSWNPSNRPVIWNSYGGIHGNLNGLDYIAYQDKEENSYIAITGYNGSNSDVVIPKYIEMNGENIPVKEIANDTFKDYTEITSVTIPDSVTTIGDSAFYNCNSVTSIYIPSSVTTLGDSAFYGCSNLTIYCEASSRPSGWDSSWNPSNRSVVWGCISFETTDEGLYFVVALDENGDKYITIAGYTGSSDNVVIPSSIIVNGEDIPVTTIADNSFYNNDTITSVIIPDSVILIGNYAFSSCFNLTRVIISENSKLTAIGESAFSNCSSLTSIYIPSSVSTIGSSAFEDCSNLTTVAISKDSQLTTIGDRAFYNCSSLTSIYIPSRVTTIGSSAFYGCSNLTIYCEASSEPSGWDYDWISYNRPVVWSSNGEYGEYNGLTYGISIDNEGNHYIVITGYNGTNTNLVIPEYIEVNGEQIVVKKINNWAFYDNDTISSLYIPSSVTTIEFGAFYGCSNLTTVTISENSQLTSIGNSAFYDCGSLLSIYIPDSVTTIGSGAFYSCSKLTTVTISENSQLTSIGSEAFSGCSSLTLIYIPDSVTTIEYGAFYGCSNLTTVTISENSQLISIGSSAFEGCSSLTSIYIPDSVTTIGSHAFNECSNLTTVTISENSQLTTIGYSAFEECSSLTSIYIPSSVTTMGDSVFYGCSNLTIYCEASSRPSGWDYDWNDSNRPVVWSSNGEYGEYNGLTYGISIDNEGNHYIVITGYNGTNTNVVIPEYIEVNGEQIVVKKISNGAFYDNDTISSLYIPSSVTTIEFGAFYGCSNLTTVTISENSQLTSIGNSAFYDCGSLLSIYIPDSVTTIGSGAFYSCSKLTTVTISENSQLTSIGSEAFSGCSSLTLIYIPDSVTTIEFGAFYGCSNLTTVTISENSQLTTIGDYAFGECSSLTSIYIPSSVTTIEYLAFYGCSNLTTVTISENSQLTTIGDYAFLYCTSLTSIYIPGSVTTIGYRAFYGCSNLTIYCELSSKPSGWNSYWNDSNRPVIWNSYGGIHGNLNGLDYIAYQDSEGNSYIAITGYNGSNNDVVIPKYIEINGENIPVKEIANYTFKNYTEITSVTIPDSVTTIGDFAFYNCSSLTSIYIPSSVSTIGSSAFEDCSNLTIYCEASSRPDDWDSYWNYSKRPVLWNITYEDYLAAIA